MDYSVLIIIAVIAVIAFLVRSFRKRRVKKRKADFVKANKELPKLREEAFRITGQLQRYAEERKRRHRRECGLNIFCDFFEDLGTDSTDRLRSQENEYANRQTVAEVALQVNYDRTLQGIEKAQQTIQRGWK